MNIEKVLVTCSKNNIGSAKAIIRNGGMLDSEEIDNGELFQRYWIEL
jgi:predicted acetyltransferase